ncbi:uncharacterized protein CLUP02_01326 [Colletotrichum lupini]|uniref:Uncharacterized protein n=1 Tax=Colletotrichum lupini TaxID=145971 RepID=A0A9Q8SC52_9PEZI|nr:uncharacterized protein CLUP02_01326 [Colletotrichum lupini]UQC74674.1 hypothetical protein CLUP02_01326 [Colletotrichum lupini]
MAETSSVWRAPWWDAIQSSGTYLLSTQYTSTDGRFRLIVDLGKDAWTRREGKGGASRQEEIRPHDIFAASAIPTLRNFPIVTPLD